MRGRSPAVLATAAVLLLLQLSVAGVSTGPVVEPVHQYVVDKGTARVACRFDAPLTDCRVRVREGLLHVDIELDFGRGDATPPVPVIDPEGKTRLTAKYAGAGLAQGHCGVELVGLHWGQYIVQCRGQNSETGDWSQGFGLMDSSVLKRLATSTLSPRLIVASPGSDVSVLLTAQEALDYCSIDTPAGYERVVPGRSPESDSRYRLHGAGLGRGECGYTLTNVSAADAGLWVWYAGDSPGFAIQIVAVAVAAPPVGKPLLRLDDASQLRAGDTLRATCQTAPSVPPAEISWLLGDRVVRADAWNSTLDADAVETALPWESQPTRQTLEHVVTYSDLGKTLECRVSHVGLVSPQSSSVELADMGGFYIQNMRSGLVLSVRGNEAHSPIIMAEYNANNAQNQLWTYKENMLFSHINGLVLDVNKDGVLFAYREHGGPNQRWYFEGKTNAIRNGNGKVMAVAVDRDEEGTILALTRPVANTPVQQFVTVSPSDNLIALYD